jgi:hypothetical protein
LPIQHSFSQEPSLLVFLSNHIIPLEETTSQLFVVHTHYEVTHNSMSLLLHFGDKMLLPALSLLDLLLEI